MTTAKPMPMKTIRQLRSPDPLIESLDTAVFATITTAAPRTGPKKAVSALCPRL